MSTIAKPQPRINPTNRPFFDGCNESRLMLQRCRAPACGRHVYFPRVCCPHCGGGDLAWDEGSGKGTIVSFTVIHRPNHESFFPEAPYYFAAIGLDEGPLMYSRVLSKPDTGEDLIGRRVEVVFVPHGEKQKLPYFRCVD